MVQKILLLGGTGVLSTDITRLAASKGHQVYMLNRGRNKINFPGQVTLLKADVKNQAEAERVLGNESFDVVVDFISYGIPDLKNSLNLLGDRCKQFVFISSACVYRRADKNELITEDSPLGNPDWDYSMNKVACEELLKEDCSRRKINYTIVRPYITYGNTRIPYGIMPPYGWHWTFVERILHGKPIFIWDDGSTVCTLTHTSDFAKGVVGLFSNPSAYNEAFHVVGDETFSWKEVAEIIGEAVGKRPVLVEIPSAYAALKVPSIRGMLLGDRALNAVFDNSKIKRVVPEFVCDTDLRHGIRQTLDYYRNNGYLNGMDYTWDASMDRLIADYLSADQLSLQKYNLKFTPYSSTISFKEKAAYLAYRYIPYGLMDALRKFRR